MKPLEIIPHMDRALLHITPQEAADPAQITQDYCDDYTPGESRRMVESLVNSALIYDETYNDPRQREILLLWRHRILRSIEATYAQQQIVQDQGKVLPLPPMATAVTYA